MLVNVTFQDFLVARKKAKHYRAMENSRSILWRHVLWGFFFEYDVIDCIEILTLAYPRMTVQNQNK